MNLRSLVHWHSQPEESPENLIFQSQDTSNTLELKPHRTLKLKIPVYLLMLNGQSFGAREFLGAGIWADKQAMVAVIEITSSSPLTCRLLIIDLTLARETVVAKTQGALFQPILFSQSRLIYNKMKPNVPYVVETHELALDHLELLKWLAVQFEPLD